jgi:hypothetical protein
LIRWWVELWDRREPPDVLGLVRMGVGLVMLYDYLVVARLGLVVPLFADEDAGGMVAATKPLWATLVGTDATGAMLLHAGLVGSSLALALGAGSRISAFVLMLLASQWAQLLPEGDRAIDMLLRNVLLVLAFSPAGDAYAVDAWWTTGSFRGSGAPRPAWARYLLVLQIVVMYFTAGVQKYGQHWWPWGGFSALYVILHDWSYATMSFDWLGRQPFYFSTQVATAVTLAWQWTYPVVLVHYFPPRSPPGRFRSAFDRYRLHRVWIAIGAFFHFGIAATMQLGIFPWGMLAVYPVFLHPDELFRRRGEAAPRV